jgi:putative peptidoglycan lipid II flippase
VSASPSSPSTAPSTSGDAAAGGPAGRPTTSRRPVGGATAVGLGILLSRIAGLVRERVTAHYLGTSPAAGALKAALRIPNILQNLLGEGVLSASFVPVYARLLAAGRTDDARRLARTVGTLLALVASLAALVGVFAAEPLVDVITPGFFGETREYTVTMVRILFPATALLVMSAWCLGVLSGHRRFFMSYAAPALWNVAIIAATIAAGRYAVGDEDDLAVWVVWGAVIGSALQLIVQLPGLVRLMGAPTPSLAVGDPELRTTVRSFTTVLLGRGSVQLSSYLDQILASYLGPSVVAALGSAQILYLLPISLFGMAISAAELPEMAAETGASDGRAAIAERLRERLRLSLRRVVFLVIPSAVAFVAIGGSVVGLVFETGEFRRADTEVVWLILAGCAVGLSGGTQGRLLASAFYALGKPRLPLYAALVRLGLTFVAGWIVVFPLRTELDYSVNWAAFGLTASAGVAAWIEFSLLRRWLSKQIGPVPVPTRLGLLLTLAASIAGVVAGAASWLLMHQTSAAPWQHAAVAIPLYGAIYFAICLLAKVPEAQALLARVRRRRR